MEMALQSIRSDELPRLVALLRQIPAIGIEVGLFRADLILDANVVIRDLLWLARKRKNPAARTTLMELMDCEVVRAYAPCFLAREINANIPVLAAQHGIHTRVLRDFWRDYRKRIHFVAVGGPAKSMHLLDPKDAPYLRLQKRLEFPIASDDAHIPAMGGSVVRVQIFNDLRVYSRNTAVEYHLKVCGVGSVMLAAAIGQAMLTFIRGIGSAPKVALWCGAVLIALLVAHPTSRRRIFNLAGDLIEGGSFAAKAAFDGLVPIFERHLAAKDAARATLEHAKQALPAGVVRTPASALRQSSATDPKVEITPC